MQKEQVNKMAEVPAAAEEFIERMGLVTQGEGMPRIAGRILGVLILHDEAFSFSELSEKLAVSRASISTNTRLLENLQMIERTTKKGERQDYFRLSKNPYISLMEGVHNRMKKAHQMVKETQSTLPEGWEVAQARLDELGDFYNEVLDFSSSITRKNK
jgi:DNA-binding transcriptional regulator GbsR (MarR family)